jgi:hypothetical protein
MKALLKILAGVAALGIVALVLALYLTARIENGANDFFDAIKAKEYQKAYGFLSKDFKAATSEEEFIAFLNRNALLAYKAASWPNRSVSGDRGELDGTITTETDGTILVRLSFVKEQGEWKIYSIQKARAGILSEDASGVTPSGTEEMALVRKTMNTFAKAVNAKNFKDFHAYVSLLWQKQVTAEQLNKIFKPFMDADLDLLFLDNYMPIFDEAPSLNPEGVLSIKGYYPTKPSRVHFDFGYIREGADWKLVKTHVNIKPTR